jgi:RIO-like serine/threonine protein kinase
MIRDQDYLRALLFEIEGHYRSVTMVSNTIAPSPEEEKRRYHVKLLCDAGFMTQMTESGYRLTNQGHDYLDAIRDEGIWRRTKDVVAETGGNATLEIMKKVATGFLKEQIKLRTGIDI